MEYAPKKVFVLENGTYLELSCSEFRQKEDTYSGRWFIPLHGMLMEVPEDAYKAFYKRKRREKYLKDCSKDNGDFSYDMLTTDEFNGEDILVDTVADTQGQAERNLLIDKLRESLKQLSPSDQKLIQALYVQRMTEREYASMTVSILPRSSVMGCGVCYGGACLRLAADGAYAQTLAAGLPEQVG